MSSRTPQTRPLIPELLRLICEQCENPTLVSLATTCKAFERPALDVLWYDLDDFYHLVMCIPELYRVEETRRVYGEDIKHVTHQGPPLVSAAMTRFVRYAEKVHRVTFHERLIKNFEWIHQSFKPSKLASSAIHFYLTFGK